MQITHFKGQQVAADIGVWNPSFDVTPATLIEGIITERVGGWGDCGWLRLSGAVCGQPWVACIALLLAHRKHLRAGCAQQ